MYSDTRSMDVLMHLELRVGSSTTRAHTGDNSPIHYFHYVFHPNFLPMQTVIQ